MLLRTTSYPRAGLLGNPSDGYNGKTIAFSFEDFGATVTIYETPEIEFVPGHVDDACFTDLASMAEEIRRYGYYGGVRLLKATARVFADYCREHEIALPARNFTARYESDIPRLVGLGGSSAICTAMFKSLLRFYEVEVPVAEIPTLCWEAELRELGIQCGMQDRVIQIYDGAVFMDFERDYFEAHRHGRYAPIPTQQLPRLFLAYDPGRAEFSGVYHHRLHVLFEERKADIVAAMSEFADLAQQGYEALCGGRAERLPALIDANFDLRERVFNVAVENARMVREARQAGCAAKFAGSGGAIVGSYEDEKNYRRLCLRLEKIGCSVLRPCVSAGRLTSASDA